jgi:hypothetical protein
LSKTQFILQLNQIGLCEFRGDFASRTALTIMKLSIDKSVLMQYATPFPDEYDVEKLNGRIKEVAPAFDNYPGLFFKLYAVNVAGPLVINEYSSIYLWAGVDPMRKFLAADRFHNYAEAFARPSVRYWLPFVIEGEVPSIAGAKFALRQTVGIPRTTKVGDFLEQWNRRARGRGALFHVAAFDPTAWELVDLSVWRERPGLEWKSDLFHIAHVSLGDPLS